jgi:hypothetical protein
LVADARIKRCGKHQVQVRVQPRPSSTLTSYKHTETKSPRSNRESIDSIETKTAKRRAIYSMSRMSLIEQVCALTFYRGPLQRNVLTLALCCFVTAHLHAPICPLWHPEEENSRESEPGFTPAKHRWSRSNGNKRKRKSRCSSMHGISFIACIELLQCQ